MKLTKAEKIWIAVVVIFYFLYNLPFFPKYYMPKAAILHMIITVIPLWIAIYIGFFKICRGKEKKNSNTSDTAETPVASNTSKKEDVVC